MDFLRKPPHALDVATFACGVFGLSIGVLWVSEVIDNALKWLWLPTSNSTSEPVSIAQAVNFAQSNCFIAARAVTASASIALDSRCDRTVRGLHVWPYVGAFLWLRCVKMPSCIKVSMAENGGGHAFALLQQDEGRYALVQSYQARFAVRHEAHATVSAHALRQWMCGLLKDALSWSAIWQHGVFVVCSRFLSGHFIASGDKVFQVARGPCGDAVHDSLSNLMGCKSTQYVVHFEFVPHNAAKFGWAVPLMIPLCNTT
jgi:hypothetical protein